MNIMRRDWELIRRILLKMEQGGADDLYYNGIEGHSHEEVSYHLYLLYEAGLIEGIATQSLTDLYPEVYPTAITWKGHDLLEHIRDDNRWKKFKRKLQEIGGELAKTSIPEVIRIITRGLG